MPTRLSHSASWMRSVARADITRVGTLTFIGLVSYGDEKTGWNERARLITESAGEQNLWGNTEAFREAAQFFTALADEQEKQERQLSRFHTEQSCCGTCNSNPTSIAGQSKSW